MNKRTRRAAIVGAVLLAFGWLFRVIGNQEGVQILLFFPTFVLVGVVAAGVKRAMGISVTLASVAALVSNLTGPDAPQGALKDPNQLAALVIFFVLIPALVAGGLGAIGGLIGRVAFRRRGQAEARA